MSCFDLQVVEGRAAWLEAWRRLSRSERRAINRLIQQEQVQATPPNSALAIGFARRWLRRRLLRTVGAAVFSVLLLRDPGAAWPPPITRKQLDRTVELNKSLVE